jgi:hypothetical protein
MAMMFPARTIVSLWSAAIAVVPDIAPEGTDLAAPAQT